MHPGLIMIACGILVMLLPRPCRKPIAIIAPILATLALLQMNENSSLIYKITETLSINFIKYDKLAFAFMLIFCVISIINSLFGEGISHRYECGMSLIYAGSIMGVVLAGDCLSLIIFWEISAFASMYVIYAGHTRTSSRAAFRYILVHAFGGNMFLAGMLVYMFHYGNDISNLANCYDQPCFWLILIGMAVNAAIPPLNSWLSDAYPESTITGAVYLSSFTTKAAIYAMTRVFAGTEALVWVGAVMAVYGAVMAIMENDIRRLLSYHIVSQLGMMIAALAVGSQVGIDGATAHAITNILYKGVLMMGAGAVIYATGKRKITHLGGLGKRMPVTSVCFLISSIAIAGLPGTSGFVSKALIMDALNEGGFRIPALLLVVAGVGTLLSITLKINYFVFWGPCDEAAKSIELKKVPWTMKAAMIIGTILTLAIGFCPQQFYGLLPYETAVNPYTLGHIMEYVAITIGGCIPFFMYIKKMAPHDEYTIDFDWFYRRPLFALVNGLAGFIHKVFDVCGEASVKFARSLGLDVSNPYHLTENSKNATIRNLSFENEDQPIGDTVSIILFAVTLIMVLAATLI